MNIKNQNYAHEKVWHLTFFLVTFLFEFIDQKFEFFKGGGGLDHPPVYLHKFTTIFQMHFFSSSRPKETKVDQAVLMVLWRIWQKSHSVSV